jgi:hypothetical protein
MRNAFAESAEIARLHAAAVTGRDIEPRGDSSHPHSPDYRDEMAWVREEFTDRQLDLIARALGCTRGQAVRELHHAELDRRADEAL